jgi:hypothetical protein
MALPSACAVKWQGRAEAPGGEVKRLPVCLWVQEALLTLHSSLF